MLPTQSLTSLILPGCKPAQRIPAREQNLTRLPTRQSQIVIEGGPGLIGEFESHGPTPLLLADGHASSAYPLGATSSTRIATTSQPRSLLSIARLKSARSRLRFCICSRVRMAQTWLGLKAASGR